MIARCHNPDHRAYKWYGARGIEVCERWHDFENFLADVGFDPFPKATLDRIDNDKGYSPDNVRWATHAEQHSNMRSNVFIEIDGVSKTIQQWEAHYGYRRGLIGTRLKMGWDEIKAVTTPQGDHWIRVTVNGETRTLSGWATHLGIKRSSFQYWMNKPNPDPEQIVRRFIDKVSRG